MMPQKPRTTLFWIVTAIAVLTLISGVVQLLKPRFVLQLVGGPQADPVPYFFSIIGMFMAIFGAMVIGAMLSSEEHPLILLWAAVQKLGACAAVAMGVLHLTFVPTALAVAGFDLLSGVLMLIYGGTFSPRPGTQL